MEERDSRPVSPWLESVPLTGAPLAGDLETEVVVVGGGAAGLAAAAALAGAGRGVVVLERRSLGGGLSGRSSGALLASSGRWLARDVRDLGLEKARARRALAQRGLAFAREVAAVAGLALDACGSTLLALSPREWADAEVTHRLLQEAGQVGHLLDRDAARARSGAALAAGGLHEPGDAAVDPVALVRALARRAVAAGARMCEGTAVVGVEEPGAGGVIVRTARGAVRAGMAVLALNAWLAELQPALGDRVVPQRAQALLLAPGALAVPPGVWVANHGHEHWRALPGGGVWFGGCRETSPASEGVLSEESTGKLQGMMERFVTKAFPAVRLDVSHRWAAAAAVTCDGMPLVGPPPGSAGIVLAAGFGEHELALALGAGKLVADLVQVGRVDSAEPFSARRFF